MQRSFLPRILGFYICIVRDKKFSSDRLAFICCTMQGRKPTCILGFYCSIMYQKHCCHVTITSLGRPMEGGTLVCILRLYICAMIQKPLHNIRLILSHGAMQSCSTLNIFFIDILPAFTCEKVQQRLMVEGICHGFDLLAYQLLTHYF